MKHVLLYFSLCKSYSFLYLSSPVYYCLLLSILLVLCFCHILLLSLYILLSLSLSVLYFLSSCLLSFSSDFLYLSSTFSFIFCLFLCLLLSFLAFLYSTFFLCLPSTMLPLLFNLFFCVCVFYYYHYPILLFPYFVPFNFFVCLFCIFFYIFSFSNVYFYASYLYDFNYVFLCVENKFLLVLYTNFALFSHFVFHGNNVSKARQHC